MKGQNEQRSDSWGTISMRRGTVQGKNWELIKDTVASHFDNIHCRLRNENGMSACVTTILGRRSAANDSLETHRTWNYAYMYGVYR